MDAPLPLLASALGTPFLGYVLALDEETVERWLRSGDEELLSASQRRAVESLVTLMSIVPTESLQDDFLRSVELSRVLGHQHDELGRSYAHVVRGIATDGVPVIQGGGDEVLDGLAELAFDVYPLLLLPRQKHGVSMVAAGSVFNHSARQRFESAVMAEGEALAKLFPDYNETSGHHGHLMANTGHGGSTQLWSLSSQLLSNAWVLTVAEFDRSPTPEEYFSFLEATLDRARRAASGEACKIPVRVGLTGALFPEGKSGIAIGEGVARPRAKRDEAFINADSQGQLQSNDPDGTTVTINYSGDIVLELELDYKISLDPFDPTQPDWPEDLRAFEKLGSAVDTIRLGYLLRDTDDLPLLVQAWTHYFDPFSNSGFHSCARDVRQVPSLMPKNLQSSEVDEWASLTKVIEKAPPGNIRIPKRRLLQAAGERQDPGDVLVDSVIVWEALVGAKSETVFRVSGALSWLLEPEDREARHALLRDIKKLYGLRSGVVHGTHMLTDKESREEPRKALRLAAVALLTMIRDRSDLLQYRDVAVRSNQLILGA